MKELIGSFSRIKSAKVLVIGDLMLDTYTSGRVERISPEAPVPVLHVSRSENLPGGAGNVALNLVSLGAEVMVVGRVGDDREGERLKSLLSESGVDTSGIFTQEGVSTPIKNRLIAESQQLIRVDRECITPISRELEGSVLKFVQAELKNLEVIAISDCAKGLLSRELLESLISLANRSGVKTLVDPKGDDFSKYVGATLIKPNYKEALAASKLGKGATLDEMGTALLKQTGSETLMITRSEEGISLFEKSGSAAHFPVKTREVKDVTGAGDTVLAVTAVSIASNLSMPEALELSNLAAGLAIEHVGCARISLSEIAERLLETHVSNKIFDESHLFALEQALEGKKLTILGIKSEKEIPSPLFSHIQKLSSQKGVERLMLYLDSQGPDLLSLLSSLREVHFIVLQSDNLSSLAEKIHPERVFTLEGDTLSPLSNHHALIT